MGDHVIREVIDRPFTERLEDVLVHAHVDRVVLVTPLVRIIVSLAWPALVIPIFTIAHVNIRVGIVSFESMLGIRLKQAPTGMSTQDDVVLSTPFVFLAISSMHSDNITNLAHNRAILKPIRVDDYDGKIELIVDFVSQSVQTAIYNFERADPFAFATLNRVGRVYNHAINVNLIVVLRAQRMVLDLFVKAKQVFSHHVACDEIMSLPFSSKDI